MSHASSGRADVPGLSRFLVCRERELRRVAASLATRNNWAPADADDLYQEMLARLLPRFDDLPDDTAFGYAVGILRNVAREWARQRLRTSEVPWSDLTDDESPASPDTADVVATMERQRAACRAVADLPPRERQAFIMRLAGLSHREIARRLRLSETTVDGLLKRGRKRLRVQLQSFRVLFPLPVFGARRTDHAVTCTTPVILAATWTLTIAAGVVPLRHDVRPLPSFGSPPRYVALVAGPFVPMMMLLAPRVPADAARRSDGYSDSREGAVEQHQMSTAGPPEPPLCGGATCSVWIEDGDLVCVEHGVPAPPPVALCAKQR